VKFSGYDIPGRTALAPLAGWSDTVFRKICKQFGAGLVFTEMASAEGISRNQPKTIRLAYFEKTENPVGIQLFGAKPDRMALAIEILSNKAPACFDLNMGCPARKVVKKGSGSALLKDFEKMRAMVLAAKTASSVPITAKIRSGWDNVNAVQAAQLLESEGVSAITVHPRTQSQMFRGMADWSVIKQVKDAVKIPVIGNGDVNTPGDAKKMIDSTGCDFVMIGRAAMGNPWIFSHINNYLENGTASLSISTDQRLDVLIDHFNNAVQYYGADVASSVMKKQIAAYVKGLPGSTEFKRACFPLDNSDDILKTIIDYKNKLSVHSYEYSNA
jgi:tRNA-dihydrouridine synthase B